MQTILSAFWSAIKYSTIAIVSLIITSFIFASVTRLYPVAIVDGSPIWFKHWERAEFAAKNFAISQKKAAGVDGNFSFSGPEGTKFFSDIKRDTLLFLIEDKIFSQEGFKLIDGFGLIAGEEVQRAIQQSSNLKEAARTVYGLEFSEFRNLVLLPQARRDLVKKFLESRGRNLDSWLRDMKRQKSIRIFFTPYKWDGEKLN